MKKAIVCIAAALLSAGACCAQGTTHGIGAPTSAVRCRSSQFYVDDSTAILYWTPVSSGACSWSKVVDPACTTDGSGNLTCASVTTTSGEYSNGTCTTAKTLSAANGRFQNVTLTHGDACALTFTQPSSGAAIFQLKVIQSAVSSYNGTISGCKWPGGTVPTITATSGAVDIVTVYLDGTNAYCTANQAFN